MLLSCNAKFKKTTGWFLVLVMGWCLIGFNEAGVIKKRDTELRSTTEADLDDKLRVNLKEIQPTVLTAISNKSEVVTTKLQLVTGNSFVTESSKELTNNEILINEAKKLLEEEDKLIKSNKEMELKEERQEREEEEQEEQEEKKEEQEEKKEELKENDSIEQNNIKLNNLTKETKSEEEDNLQDIKQIILNLENKEQQLSDSSKSSTEFASNVIKEDKILMLGKNENKKELQQQEDISSLENNLKYNAEKPRPPSRILTELRTETEAPNKKPKQQETQLENSIESIRPAKEKESSIEIISLENNTNKTDDTISIKKEEKVSEVLNTNNLENKQNEKEYLAMKPMDFEQKENNNNNNEKVNLNTTPLMQINENEKETSTSVNQVTEDKEVLEIITINPFNNLNNSKVEDQEISLNEDQSNSNKIQDGLDLEELFKSKQITTTESSLSELATTLQPEPKEGDLLIFEGEKKEYARSMFKEDLTTLRSTDNNEILMPITTYRPIILSVKEENLTDHIIDNKSFNIKEKKPKFINDNSTNAQQLNLPNNAEVWSLASMKSLPKVNVSLETEQAHNQTIKKDFEENLVNNNNNNNNNNNTMMKINSEKNLLDWSQIMRDKELSTTTRNEEEKVTEKFQEPEQEQEKTLENNAEFKEEEVTLNSLLDKENLNNIISTTTKATILSFSNNNNNNNDNINNNETDKKFKENMNNHLEMITETLDVTTTTTTATTTESTNMVNNPFNTTLNMKPNFNEINLTLKNTQAELNNHNEEEVHTTPTSTKAETETETAGKLNNDFEVKTKLTSTPTSLLMTTLTSTETTAVNDMTTVEQISSETTTVSTLETSKQNTTLNNIDPRQTEYETYNNVNFVKSNYSTEHYNNNNELEINTLEKVDIKLKNQYENNKEEEEEDLIKISTTTTVLPITTFRPNILAITSTTSIPVKIEQEISDQNGNNEFQTQQQQQQSITETNLNVNNKNNTIKISETHLLEREFETTTVETTTTTAATATPAVELAETKTETENTLTSLGEIDTTTTTTTTTISTTTSSSKEEPITERILETKETTTTPTTPKFVKETTIGSADTINENIEKKLNETATATTENIITSTTTEITKTPVVFESFTSTPTTTTTSSTTTASYTEQNIITTTTTKPTTEKETEHNKEENILNENNAKLDPATTSTTTMSTTIITTTTTAMPVTTIKDEETYISLLDDTTTTTTTTQKLSPTISMTSTAPTPIPTSTTLTSTELSSSTSTMPSAITTKIEEIYNVIHSTTTEIIQTTTQQLITESVEDDSSTSSTSTTSSSSSSSSPLYTTLETETTTPFSNMIDTADIGKSLPTLTSIMGGNSGNMYPKNSEASGETDVNVIIAITVSVIGVIALILLVGFLYLMRKRQKQNSYPNRCRPVSMDEFTIDNASVGGSMRKSSALRSSKRTYGNLAFDDPSLRHNPMGVHELAKFVQEKLRIFEEFRDVPQITSRLDEVPPGCEDKNRYANVLPLPETRVILQRLNDDDKTEYINANYVTGPKDPPNYYIACQAPLESTVEDFWRMIWEQQSRVIIQATDLIENGVEKCAEYLPPSVTLDNHSSFGDFQITLQNREVKDKYAISTILLKNVNENASRELTHYWYKWPEVGVPSEEAPIIAMLLEARSSLISYAIEQANEDKEKSSLATLKAAEEGTAGTMNGGATSPTTNNSNGSSANGSSGEINGNISMVHIKKTARNQGPLTVHCSPGTGRTGTIIACDIAIRSLETPKRTVDIPQIVYYVRRGRASAVLTKEQYEFIYKVANMYAAKITNPTNYN